METLSVDRRPYPATKNNHPRARAVCPRPYPAIPRPWRERVRLWCRNNRRWSGRRPQPNRDNEQQRWLVRRRDLPPFPGRLKQRQRHTPRVKRNHVVLHELSKGPLSGKKWRRSRRSNSIGGGDGGSLGPSRVYYDARLCGLTEHSPPSNYVHNRGFCHPRRLRRFPGSGRK